MTDYKKDTGSSGQMMIRDTGSVVEFWITANSSATYAYDMPWAYVVNGVTSSWREYSYSGSNGWEKLGGWTVSDSQTVTFKLGDTGTNGLGGPTTFSVAIDRADPPPRPDLSISLVAGTSVFANIDSNGNGGASILEWQVGYGTSSTTPASYKTASMTDGTVSITGLTRGRTYYFWGRGRNEKGWGAWSSRVTVTTDNVPEATPFLIYSYDQDSVYGDGDDGDNNGDTIDARQVGYGTSSTAPQLYKTPASNGTTTITGLKPGTTYYFWYRTHNSEGWGPWSSRTSCKTWNVPSAPSSVSISSITQTSVYGTFKANASNGPAITKYEIGYGTSSSSPQSTIASDGSTTISGLLPGTKYYFWARAYNSVGWSSWSAVSSATLLAGAYVNVNNVWHAAVPYVNVNGVWKVATPMVKIAGVWKGTG